MSRDQRIQAVALGALAVFLTLSSLLATQLSASAGRNRLVYADAVENDEAPEVALGIAMGAFRGIFVNYLWIRANQLKEDGRYYEAIDLASAITKLQPRFPHVWVFHAWNMAYNISVATQTAGERWQWVNAGIRLLRDKGIPANPNDLFLHKELAWIYLHKIQGVTDDANQYYKRQFAKEWQLVLGEPPAPDPKDRSRENAIERYAAWLQPIADAPESLESLYRADPRTRALVERIRAEVGDEPGEALLRRFAVHEAAERSPRRAQIRAAMGPNNAAFAAIINDEELKPAVSALAACVRRIVLRETYRMDPFRMIRYTRKYGPIDWRHPAAHALYWSARGVEQAMPRWTEDNRSDFDFVNTDRMSFQAVQELWRSGELYFSFIDMLEGDETYAFYLAAPNAHFIQTYKDILGEVVSRSWADQANRAYSFYAAGYENFMKDAIRFYWRRGQRNEAVKLKDEMLTWEGQNLNDTFRYEYWSQPIEDFIKAELLDRATSPSVANAETIAALIGGFAAGLLGSDEEQFRSQIEFAKEQHRYYFQQQARRTVADPTRGRMEVMDRDFRMLAGGVFMQFLGILDQDQAEIAYGNAPNDLRLFAYDMLQERFRADMDGDTSQGARKFDQVFREPTGLAEHRKELERLLERRSAPQHDVIRR